MKIKSIVIIVFIIQLFSNCATFKKQIGEKANTQENYPNDKKVAHRFYLIGDAGFSENKEIPIALQKLKTELNSNKENATVLFLGDNSYPDGLPKKDDKNREQAEIQLNNQIQTITNFTGKTIFIPGNHDWYNEGVKGLKREQELIEKQLGKNSFLPKNGCPIETVKITDDIVLIIVDSQWYITDWDKNPSINDNCEIKTRTLFLEEFKNQIKKARGKTTIVAIHHPMFSNGPHSGNYSFESNFKPFPILGTFQNIIRKTSGISEADLQNKFYNELKKNLTASAQQNDKVIFVSGHEHSLQYIVQDKLYQIISGSGSKTTATKNTNPKGFSFGKLGFSILDVFEDGSSFVRFIEAEKNSVSFQTEVIKSNTITQIQTYETQFKDSIKASIYTTAETTKSKTYKFFLGERYRKYYSQLVSAKSVSLDTLFGGLQPIRKGGGNQSKSLKLKTKDGKEYVMRAMKKNASQYIQSALFKDQYIEDKLDNTKSEAFVKDIFTGSFPYAPFVVSGLSEAIKIPHLNPKLYYVPKQNELKEFNVEFGDELYLIEEQSIPTDIKTDNGFTGNSIDTYELIEKLQKNNDNSIDEVTYIRARLFDMLIGDWDRHHDQWRWLEYKQNGKTIFKPLARDRDQAFSIMSDGALLGAAVRLIPEAALLLKYNNDLVDVKGFNAEPYPLDMLFIKNSSKENWNQQVEIIIKSITNEVIEKAFLEIPKEINHKTVQEIKFKLEQRLKNLSKISDRYFKELNKNIVITGTNNQDYFKINCQENGDIELSINQKKDEILKEQYFNKTYLANQTKEIWLYGLDNQDTFEVIGKSKKIVIRIIGGQNNDKYSVSSGKNIFIYDYKSKSNDLDKAKKATISLTDNYETNVYDYKKLKSNINKTIPTVGFNGDDGYKIGVTNTFTHFGFLRNPFTAQHKVKAEYFFATNGYDINYTGEFAKVIGNYNLLIKAGFKSPNFSLNFFGYGNETINNDKDLEFNYNRVKVRSNYINPSIIWRGRLSSSFEFGINYEKIEVQNTEARFVENNSQLPKTIFNGINFAGTNVKYHFENYDNKAFPTLGIETALELGFKQNLDDKNRNYAYIIPEISFDYKLIPSGNLVLATKSKGKINFGNNFEFYQAASIGGFDGLRGYRNQRFTGNSSFYQNTDLRYCFNQIKTNILPIRYGMYGSFDFGKVWANNVASKKWNNSFGGGLFLNATEIITANLGIFKSYDGIRLAFNLGFQF
jgi:Calcineurin-like phosphoesterase